jgi:hypothetical protein
MSQTTENYLQSLPEADTARMPKGTIFVANRLIYEVVESGNGGFARARQWRHGESTDVALVPNSFLTRTLPLVARGRMLPLHRSRTELTNSGSVRGFIFPSEALAKDAAYLDVALVQAGGVYVRNHQQEPAFAVTDGVQFYRLYYFMQSDHGRPTHVPGNIVENPHCELRPHTEGDIYWRLLPTWQDRFPAAKQTQLAIPKVILPELPIESDNVNSAVTREMPAIRREDLEPTLDSMDATVPTRPVNVNDLKNKTQEHIPDQPFDLDDTQKQQSG